jgi:hypothetical protein
MHYLMTIVGTTRFSSDGVMSPDAIEAMNRAFPEWNEKTKDRRLFGRELDLPGTASIVRVRDGEPLVVDGPFAETKEFMAGFDLLDCANLDDAIEVASSSPVAWHHRIEIRPFIDGVRLTGRAAAFGRGDGNPYLLISWTRASRSDLAAACERWRDDLTARGLYVLGNQLGGANTATTISTRGGSTELEDGPFTETPEFIAAIDVVDGVDREEAINLAATHPVAGTDAIEVRPFYSE